MTSRFTHPVAMLITAFNLNGLSAAQHPPALQEREEIRTQIDVASPDFWSLPAEAQLLLSSRPGAQAATIGLRVAAFYGADMAIDINADAAHENFWIEHGSAFGVDGIEIVTTAAMEMAGGGARVYASTQYIQGLPVEYTTARVLVEVGEFSRVKYAAARLAPTRTHAFPPIALRSDDAIAFVCKGPHHNSLTDWSVPELVVYAGEPQQWESGPGAFGEPVRAWKFRGDGQSQEGFAAFTFFVDAATGAILHVRDEVYHTDVVGVVQAKATPGTRPDFASNSPTIQPLPNILVRVTGGNSAFSDENGNFVISHAGTTPVSVITDVSDGQWVSVDPNTPLAGSATFTPGVSGTLILNNTPTNANTAQANAFIHVNKIHQFLKLQQPDWTGPDQQIVAWPNSTHSFPCNAQYTGTTLLFSPPTTSQCVNMAYSSIVTHEYGHFVVNQLGLAQRAFGEGFSDVCALLLYDDPQFGREWTGEGTPALRDYSPGQPEKTYPCNSSEPHECGKILAGFWWDIRENAGNLADIQKLFTNWMLLTNGGIGLTDPAHPLTLIEILTVDDTPGLFPGGDGNLSNGTPHCAAICPAAVAHGIPCDAQPYCDAGPPPPPGTNRIISFYPPQIWKSSENGATGVDPFGIAVGDLNPPASGLGIQDVVIACETSNNVLVYIGQTPAGPGSTVTFAAPVAYAVGTGDSRPARVVLADMAIPNFPPDGKLDIVVSLRGQNAVQILRNQGNGTFAPGNPAQIQTITFNGTTTVLSPVGLAVADWDQNGRKDIAVAGYQTGGTHGRPTLGLGFAHNANGTYARQTLVQSTRDGHGYGLKAWTDLETLPPASFAPSGSPFRLTMTEFDNNIVPPSSDLFIFKHTSGQTFSLLQRIDSVGRSPQLAIAPIDNTDTRLDIVLVNPSLSEGVKVFLQAANDTFNPGLTFDTGPRPQSIAAGYFSKNDTVPVQLDPYIDLATVRDPTEPPGSPTYDPRVDALVNTGAIPSLAFQRLWFGNSPDPNDQPNSRDVLVVDVNGDGFPDLVTSNAGPLGVNDGFEGFSVLLNRR